jgi:hypothetical protein
MGIQRIGPRALAARKIAEAFAASTSNNELEAAALLGQVEIMSRELADSPANRTGDLLDKIKIWRVITPEDVFAQDKATPDEALVRSIVDDCERFIKLGALS